MATLFRFYLFTSHTGSLTIWQRLLGLQYGIAVLFPPIVAVINMCLTPIYLVTGVHLVYFHNLQTFRLLLRMECVAIFLTWIHECNLGVFSSIHLAIREVGTLYMSPCKCNPVISFSVGKIISKWLTYFLDYAIATLRSFFLPRSLGGTAPRFTPSGSIFASLQERSSARRAPLVARLRHILFGCGVWFHVVVVTALVFSVSYRIHNILANHSVDEQGQRDWHPLCIELLRDVLWPQPAWLVTVLACLTPIKHAFMPPNVSEREDLMGKIDGKGARYPLPSSKANTFSRFSFDFGQVYPILIMPYVAFSFLASWWI
jgi:hypothetical protein